LVVTGAAETDRIISRELAYGILALKAKKKCWMGNHLMRVSKLWAAKDEL
jgi:hypothetical protein